MSEKTSVPFLSEDWMKTQRTYWDAWSNLCKQGQSAMGTEAPAAAMGQAFGSPWTEAMDKWWHAVSPSAPKESRSFFENLVSQGKDYFRLSEEFTSLCTLIQQSGKGAENWQEMFRAQIERLKDGFGSGQGDAFGALLRGPFDQWLKGMGQCAPLPDSVVKMMQGVPGLSGLSGMAGLSNGAPWDSAVCEIHAQILRYLSTPGVGIGREYQEDVQQVVRAFLDYEQTMLEFVRAHGRIGPAALDGLHKRVLELHNQQKQIESLREIYDLWTACLEDAYREFAMSEEFSVLYGRLTNRMMVYRSRLQTVVDEVLTSLNIPTRKDMETLIRQMHGLRRELRGVEDDTAGEGDEIVQLKAEMQALRSECAEMRKGMAAALPATVPVSVSPELLALREEVAALKKAVVTATHTQPAQPAQPVAASVVAASAPTVAAPQPATLAPAPAAEAPQNEEGAAKKPTARKPATKR